MIVCLYLYIKWELGWDTNLPADFKYALNLQCTVFVQLNQTNSSFVLLSVGEGFWWGSALSFNNMKDTRKGIVSGSSSVGAGPTFTYIEISCTVYLLCMYICNES